MTSALTRSLDDELDNPAQYELVDEGLLPPAVLTEHDYQVLQFRRMRRLLRVHHPIQYQQVVHGLLPAEVLDPSDRRLLMHELVRAEHLSDIEISARTKWSLYTTARIREGLQLKANRPKGDHDGDERPPVPKLPSADRVGDLNKERPQDPTGPVPRP